VVESLQKLREPAVVVVLTVLVLRLVVALVSFALVPPSRPSSLAVPAVASVADAGTVVVLVVLVGSCVLRAPTRHARQLTGAAVVVTGLVILAYGVTAGVWLGSTRREDGEWSYLALVLLALAVPVLGLLALVGLLQGQRQARAAEQPREVGTGHAEEPAELEARVDPDQEPTWQPDQAAGAAWLTAGDAAAGAAASGWGTPGEAGGWQPKGTPRRDRPESSTPQDLDERPRT